MGIARSTYYAEAAAKVADAGIIEEMKAICDEFEAYGYRLTRLNRTGFAGNCIQS